VGPAGVAFVIVREDILGKVNRPLPTMVDYRTHIGKEEKDRSMFNTPPVFAIYVMHETLKWVKAQGGVDAMYKRNKEKAEMLYAEIDRNKMFVGTAAVEDRSLMNVCFVMNEEYKDKEGEISRLCQSERDGWNQRPSVGREDFGHLFTMPARWKVWKHWWTA